MHRTDADIVRGAVAWSVVVAGGPAAVCLGVVVCAAPQQLSELHGAGEESVMQSVQSNSAIACLWT